MLYQVLYYAYIKSNPDRLCTKSVKLSRLRRHHSSGVSSQQWLLLPIQTSLPPVNKRKSECNILCTKDYTYNKPSCFTFIRIEYLWFVLFLFIIYLHVFCVCFNVCYIYNIVFCVLYNVVTMQNTQH